jgi:autotransporter-associated beta strand protein
MQRKRLLLGALLTLLPAIVHAQLTISTNTLAPALGAYDQFYLPGPVDEATGAMTFTGNPNVASGDNDVLTYVAGDKASKGQSFTTGPNPAGYTISSVTIRHILWTNFLANGTFMNIPTASTFPFRFGTISGANITGILTTNATYSGSTLNFAGTGGTGIYFTFDLSNAGLATLAPNTTYFFELASTANPPYFELHNTQTNATSYTGGTAFYGDTTANLDQSGVVNLPPFGGEFAFVAKLAAVGAPTVTATVNPSSASSGQTFTITATVTPGVGTVTNVSVDLSAIGGSTTANLVLSNANVYTNTFTVSGGAPFGGAYLNLNAKDNAPLVGSFGILFTVLPSSRTWTGSGIDNNWSSSANWLGNLAPSFSGNSLIFAGVTRLTPNMDNNYSVSGLVFSNTAGGFTIGSANGSTLTNGNGGIVNNSASTQTLNVPISLSAAQSFNLAAGNLTLNSNVVGGANITLAGNNTLNLNGPGTSTIGNLRLGSGQLNVTAGTVNVTETSGTLTRIESNATLTVSSGSLNIAGGGGWFPIGVTAGATGAVVVAGGTISISNNYGTQVGNEAGAGILTINSGAYINNDTLPVGFMVGENGSGGGTVNLNGGVLAVNLVLAHSAGGNFYFNGGTLKPLFSNAGFWASAGTLTASVRNGGAVIDTSGFNITIGQPLLHSTVAGDNATDGGLTKIGNGTLVLSGGYQYTGPNNVLGGALNLSTASGVPGSGGDLVVANASLAVEASIGTAMPAANVSLKTGAAVTTTNIPGATAINGTGNLLVQTNTALNLNYLSLTGNPTVAAINVTGSASVTGTNNLINLTGNGFVAGQFPLIKYGSGSLASISGFKLGTLPAGVNAVLVNNTGNQSVDLNITFVGQSLSWYGATNGVVLANWDINADTNWNLGGAKYLEYNGNTFGDLVTFDDTLFNDGIHPPATNVILTAALHPSQMTMNNSGFPYVFSGPGSLAGPGSLTLNGANSVTLTTSNNYVGGTFINAGTLVITNDNELGTNLASVTLNGGTLQAAASIASARTVALTGPSTIDVVPGATAQLSGGINGTGNLTLSDSGTLNLSSPGASTTGNLRVSAGQLNLTTGTVNVTETSGTLTRIENSATVTVSGGSTLNIAGAGGWFPIGVTAGATGAVVVAGGTISISNNYGTQVGNEAGAGVLTINSGTYVNNDTLPVGFLVGENGSMGGTVNLNGGVLAVNLVVAHSAGGNFYFNGGTLRPLFSNGGFWNNAASLTASVRNGGAVVDTSGFNITIAQPLVHSTVAGDNALDGGLLKIGNGRLTLNGTNTFTGPTIVNGGTLAGVGTIAGLLTNNATLSPGTGGSGALIVNGNITLNASSTNTFSVNGTSLAKSSVTVGSSVSYGGLLNIVPAGTFTAGQQFQLFSGAGATNAGNFASIAGSAGSGLAFSFTNGVLSVIASGPSGPAHLTNSFAAGTLSLSWPSGQGWRLQTGTNIGSTNWVYSTDASVSSTNITVDPSKPTQFYRLVYP